MKRSGASGEYRVVTETVMRKTRGAGDLHDITGDVAKIAAGSGIENGAVLVFVVGSTAGITTLEFEPGLVQDMRDAYERLAPRGRPYAHDAAWGDANGFSHVRAALQGPSLTVPVEGRKLMLGTWQQIVLAEFDNRSRERTVVVQASGVVLPG